MATGEKIMVDKLPVNGPGKRNTGAIKMKGGKKDFLKGGKRGGGSTPKPGKPKPPPKKKP